jgi:hypothetical protein
VAAFYVGVDWLWLNGWSDFVKLCSPTRPFYPISLAPGEGHAAEHSTMLVIVVGTIGQTREKEMRGQMRQGGRRIYSRPSTRWVGALTGVREVFRDQTFLVLPSSLSFASFTTKTRFSCNPFDHVTDTHTRSSNILAVTLTLLPLNTTPTTNATTTT